MRSFTLAALALASLPLALAATPAPVSAGDGQVLLSPESIGAIFCLARTGNDMAPVEGLLTGQLSVAIADALALNHALAAANPGEKPPLGDGVPWASFPDYAATCTVAEVAVMRAAARVTLAYRFPDAPDLVISDVLTLVPVDDPVIEARRWRIDNVLYPEGGDLRTALAEAFAGD